MRGLMPALTMLLLAGCAPAPTAPPGGGAQVPQSNSILVSSSPANGATVAAPVNTISLQFDPPARLGEVTVTGPDGVMPMMVNAVGDVRSYAIPVAGLGAGNYRVDWKASVGGAAHHGSFGFTVR